MKSISIAWLTAMVLVTAGAAVAQQNGGTAPATAPAPAAQAATPPAASTKAPAPKSKAEAQALQSLNAMVQNPATQPDQLQAAITDFTTKYPSSDYLAMINVWGMQYAQQHQDYDGVLGYGETALKYNPNDLFALMTIATDIPIKSKDTDLDRDQRLAEAETDANRALTLLAVDAPVYNGKTLTPDMKASFQAGCYSALGRLALDRKQYTTAVENYQKAVALDDADHKPMDYFLMSQAQEGLQKYSDADASLDQVIASNNPALAELAKQEKAKIAPKVGH